MLNHLKTTIKRLVPQPLINTFWHLPKAYFWHWYYGRPSHRLQVIGITGSDGKTTTTMMLYSILKATGKKVAVISTVSAIINGVEELTGFHVTNPPPKQLQSYLKRAAKAGSQYVILETTSHGLYQHRVAGIRYQQALFTNVSEEHLDHHGTYENLIKTKGYLMKRVRPGGIVALNCDDKSFKQLRAIYDKYKLAKKGVKLITYGSETQSDYQIRDIEIAPNGRLSFLLTRSDKPDFAYSIVLRGGGKYNAYNATLALISATEIGIEQPDKAVKGLRDMKTISGRWETLQEQPFKVVVDFAHTANGLKNVLSYAREMQKGNRIILVFGAASQRDVHKRPVMGKWAEKYADVVILTAEDPRGESVEKINEEISSGMSENFIKGGNLYSIPDRRHAIAQAISLARPGDLVLITGKGHERSMNLDGKTETPWSDQEAVREALEGVG